MEGVNANGKLRADFILKPANCLSQVQAQGTAMNNFSTRKREDVRLHYTP
jgi:hypothetical protein